MKSKSFGSPSATIFGFSTEHIPDHSPVLSYFRRTASQQFDCRTRLIFLSLVSFLPFLPLLYLLALFISQISRQTLSLSRYNHFRFFPLTISLFFPLLQLNYVVDACRIQICMFPMTYGSNKCVFALNSYTTPHINICC